MTKICTRYGLPCSEVADTMEGSMDCDGECDFCEDMEMEKEAGKGVNH